MTASPALGLLLDVDGPIASPVSRTIAIPSIIADLVTLANEGTPIVFNTGRSDVFIRDQVVGPLLAAGLSPEARVYGVCEKGAVWFGITPDGVGEIQVDASVALPAAYGRDIEALVAERYADTMFFDHSKRAMVSVEQRVEVPTAVYREAQRRFDDEAFALFAAHGLGGRHGTAEIRDAKGRVPFRIDPTIISTDIEAVTLGKDLGAERGLAFVGASGPLPRVWRTVGDSRTDYAMADYLHREGYEVAHVDVRPGDGVPQTAYEVLTAGDLIHDEAGAHFLSRWVEDSRAA